MARRGSRSRAPVTYEEPPSGAEDLMSVESQSSYAPSPKKGKKASQESQTFDPTPPPRAPPSPSPVKNKAQDASSRIPPISPARHKKALTASPLPPSKTKGKRAAEEQENHAPQTNGVLAAKKQAAKQTKPKVPRAKAAKEPKRRATPQTDAGGWVTKISKTTKAAPAPRKRTKGSQSTQPTQEEESETQPPVDSTQTETQEPEAKAPPKKRGKPVSESKIYGQICQEGTAVKLIVTEFLKSYKLQKGNPEKALCELTNFIIQSCGSDALISVADYSSRDRDDILDQVQLATGETELGDVYPIVSKHKNFKKFKSRFVEFFKKFVVALQKDPDTLYDGRLLPSLADTLSVFSGSTLRSFRHTCTVAACELVNALIGLVKEEFELKDKAQRGVAGKGQVAGATAAKIAQLTKDIDQYQARIDALDTLIEAFWNNVFVHRYRDIDASIRAFCLDSFGVWMLSYPSKFLVDNSLKYAGWCLFDKSVPVRRAALESILAVVQTGDEEVLKRMEGLLVRFKPRLIAMAEDVDVGVAAKAIDLLTTLLKFTEIVGEDEAPKIPSYIWDIEPSIRKAAVEFAFQDIFAVEEGDEKKDPLVRNEEDLIQFLKVYRTFCPHALAAHETDDEVQEGAREGIECLVDGFWSYLPFLQEWDLIYARLTLSEKGQRKSKKDAIPDDNEQELLLYVLLACAKKVIGSDKRVLTKLKLTKKDKDEIDQKSEVLSTFLVRYLPDLLSTFQADKGKVKALVELVRFVELEQFVKQRKTQDFVDLMEILQKIYLKQTDPVVLEEVACTMRHLCKSDHKLQDKAEEVVREMASKLSERFKHLAEQEHVDKRGDADLLAVLVRIECLSRFMYLKQMSYDATYDGVLQSHMLAGKHEAVELLLKLCCENIFYLRANLNADKTTDKTSKATIKEILKQNMNFLSHLQYILSHPFEDKLKTTAFLLASDLFVVFSPSLLKKTALEQLALPCPEEIKSSYVNYFHALVTQTGEEEPDDEAQRVLWVEEQARLADDREAACRAACKVVIHDFPNHRRLAATLISFLLRFSKEVDEIVKIAINSLRNISQQSCLQAQFGALTLAYETTKSEPQVTELAKRLALTHTPFHQVPVKKPSAAWTNFFQHALDWVMEAKDTSRFGFLESAIGPFLARASPYDVGAMYKYWKVLEAKAREEKEKILAEEDDEDEADEGWGKLETFADNLDKTATRKGVKGIVERHMIVDLKDADEEDNRSVATHATVRSVRSVKSSVKSVKSVKSITKSSVKSTPLRGDEDLDFKHTDEMSLRLSMSPIRAVQSASKPKSGRDFSALKEDTKTPGSKGKRSVKSSSSGTEEQVEGTEPTYGKRSRKTPKSQAGSQDSDYEAGTQEPPKLKPLRSRGG